MSPLLFAVFAVFGGAGAVARLLVDTLVRRHTHGVLPWGTIVINLVGSFLLGLLTALHATHVAPDAVYLVGGAGFLGGFTTFSTASLETIRLLQERRWLMGTLNALGLLVSATACAALGLWVGYLL